MAEKLTMKQLSSDLETVRTQVHELEQQLERKLKTTLEKALAALESRIDSVPSPAHGASIDAQQRRQMIAEEAYLIAEQRGFQGGDPALDWSHAEEQVNRRLMQGNSPARPPVGAKKPATKRGASRSSSRAR